MAWLQSGDTTVIEENWDAMGKYLASIEADNPDYLWKKNYGIPFGDWLSPEGPTLEPLVATAYWAYDVTLMKEMARALGNAEDESKYSELYRRIQEALAMTFVQVDGFITGADKGSSPFGQINNPNVKASGGDTQTSYVLALEMGLVPESLRQAAADKLVGKIRENKSRLGTGFLGTPTCCRAGRHRSWRHCLQTAAEYRISIVGLPGRSWGNDDVGTLEWGSEAQRLEHELV